MLRPYDIVPECQQRIAGEPAMAPSSYVATNRVIMSDPSIPAIGTLWVLTPGWCTSLFTLGQHTINQPVMIPEQSNEPAKRPLCARIAYQSLKVDLRRRHCHGIVALDGFDVCDYGQRLCVHRRDVQ